MVRCGASYGLVSSSRWDCAQPASYQPIRFDREPIIFPLVTYYFLIYNKGIR